MKRLPLAALVGAMGVVGLLVGQTFAASTADPIRVVQADDAALFAALMEEGEDIYRRNCAGCHGREGEGTNGPVFAGNGTLSSAGHVIGFILSGNENHGMPAWADVFDDREVAAVGTYIRNSWGNAFGVVRETSVTIRR